jgi:hypothetical protein
LLKSINPGFKLLIFTSWLCLLLAVSFDKLF